MTKKIRVAVAGLGVVGSGVVDILLNKSDLLKARSGYSVELASVSSRKKRDYLDYKKVKFFSDAIKMAQDDEIDIVVELIGGSDGIAYELCKEALANKKHVVTANKAMIAHHGTELAKIAEENSVLFFFEASVAGSIPIIKNLKEGLAANRISKIYAILNGTCNYILTAMEKTGKNFSEILDNAQKLGYAEADPTFDIEGIDTAHKLAIMAAIAQGAKPDFKSIYTEGITGITIKDIKLANKLGYKIKLLGIFESYTGCNKNGSIAARAITQNVYPALVDKREDIANIGDSYNCVKIYGDECEWSTVIGRGAGSKPTASSVVADILDVARYMDSGGAHRSSQSACTAPYAFGIPADSLKESTTLSIDDRAGDYYIRFNIDTDIVKNNSSHELLPYIIGKDKFDIAKVLIGDFIVDDNDNPKNQTAIAITIRSASEELIANLLNGLRNSDKDVSDINMIRIENL